MCIHDLFKQKLELEYRIFCRELLAQDPGFILESAYRADCMKNIYEITARLSEGWAGEMLQTLLVFPGLLEYLYACWIKEEDIQSFEMERCLRKTAVKITKAYRENVKGGEAA